MSLGIVGGSLPTLAYPIASGIGLGRVWRPHPARPEDPSATPNRVVLILAGFPLIVVLPMLAGLALVFANLPGRSARP